VAAEALDRLVVSEDLGRLSCALPLTHTKVAVPKEPSSLA